jgi:type IV pilus assembly protein PilB
MSANSFSDETIKKALLSGNYVSADDMAAAEAAVKKGRGTIAEYFLSSGVLTKDLIGQALAEQYGVPYADVNSYPPTREQVLKIPEEVARQYHAVLFREEKDSAIVATDAPTPEPLAEEKVEKEEKKAKKAKPAELAAVFKDILKKPVTIAYALPEDIEAAFVHYRKALETRFSAILKEQRRYAPELVDAIFEDALSYRTSDIHFEPQETEVVIRFRVDGVLQEAGRVPKQYYDNLLNRIKVQAQLRIDEHAAMQDGSIAYKENDRFVDMRVSISPTMNGEKVAVRILSAYVASFSLADLGLAPRDQKALTDAANRPFGMILVTGPTGSGKTTTLNALVKLMNTPDVNITTIEDPVEYRIPGVNQIQVNPRTNITFARGLRSIVRQDPDIILVGEIRDQETAEIAVNAALTGHILFSTFHSNDAPTAIPRILDMGVEPFLLASTLNLILAQRLVRKICEHCRVSYEMKSSQLAATFPAYARFIPEKTVTLYRGKGCPICGDTGYTGRTAIFEVVTITRELAELILSHPSTQQIWTLARKQGAKTLFDDGIEKVRSGVTTLEELQRVAEPPQE